MSYIILIAMLLAAIHYLYEGMVAPTLRLKYRHRLFVMRDKLHNIKLEDKANKKPLMIIEEGINHFIDRMDDLTLSKAVFSSRIYERSSRIRKNIEKIKMSLDNCTNEEIKEVDRNLQKTAKKILLINSGGWFIYIVPFFLIYAPMAKAKDFVTKSLQDFIFMSEPSYNKMSNSRVS